MIWITAAVASLLATQVYAAPGRATRGLMGLHRSSSSDLEARMEEAAYNAVDRRADEVVDEVVDDTLSACMAHLSVLTSATNPSGMAMCYNIVQLDTTVGEFMADIRLFDVSPPSGAWAGIPRQLVRGAISFDGATASKATKKQEETYRSAQSVTKRQAAGGPSLYRSYTIVGKINEDRMTPPMTIEKIEPLIMPIFTLRATDATGRTVATNVSSNEAAFVHGIFSKEAILSPFNTAHQAMEAAEADLEAGKIAFVLPGVNLLIFPVGLVITSFWAMVGISVYAYGTYERYNYRDSYRKRKAMSGTKSYATRI